MHLPIKLLCSTKSSRRDGTSNIYIQYCFSAEKRTLLNTKIAIPPVSWNAKKSRIANNLPELFGNVSHLNLELVRMTRVVEDIICYATENEIPDIGSFVKRTFRPDYDIRNIGQDCQDRRREIGIQKKVSTDIYFQLDEYIQSKKNKVCSRMPNIYRQLKDRLNAFEVFRKQPISFNSLDYDFYDQFIDFLSFHYTHRRRVGTLKGLKVNTIGLTIKQLRIFIKDRVRRKIIDAIDLTDYKIPDEETDAIYLTYEEISTLYSCNLVAHPHLIEYRDLFVLACLTGLRFSDLSTLKKEDLRQNMLYKKQQKSDHWVVIPLRKEAKEIFENRFANGSPAVTNAEFNRHLKTIGKLARINQRLSLSHKKGNKDIEVNKFKYELMTSHTARRSFCTNEFLAGTPVKLIMNISGHKSEKNFYKYIRISSEEAGMKMQQIWEARGEMNAR